MAQMQLILSFEMAEELDDGTEEGRRRQQAVHRTYTFIRPEKIKELMYDKGLLGEIIRSVHADYLAQGGYDGQGKTTPDSSG